MLGDGKSNSTSTHVLLLLEVDLMDLQDLLHSLDQNETVRQLQGLKMMLGLGKADSSQPQTKPSALPLLSLLALASS